MRLPLGWRSSGPVADGQAVLRLPLCPAVSHGFDFAHELAALRERMACFVVLVVLRRASLLKADGAAAAGQVFLLGGQLRVEGATGHGAVDGAAVHLGGARAAGLG